MLSIDKIQDKLEESKKLEKKRRMRELSENCGLELLVE